MSATEYQNTSEALIALWTGYCAVVIVQAGKATGDASHVATAMAANSDVGVIVIDNKQGTTFPGKSMADRYVSISLSFQVRVAYVSMDNWSTASAADVMRAAGDVGGPIAIYDPSSPKPSTWCRDTMYLVNLTGSTAMVKKALAQGRRFNDQPILGGRKAAQKLISTTLRGQKLTPQADLRGRDI